MGMDGSRALGGAHSIFKWLRGLGIVFPLVSMASANAWVGAPTLAEESPRVQALLEQGWAAESGQGLRRNPGLAAGLYRQAGMMGSGEGYYRVALIYMPRGKTVVPSGAAACFLALASQLGHRQAAELLDSATPRLPPEGVHCDDEGGFSGGLIYFDLERYVQGLPVSKRQVVTLIRKLAPHYTIDVHLALAVATVESNFNPGAVSPMNAMGVMQLIPATAVRFGVRNPFDPEQNIRGGLAYLRWLGKYYQGDTVRVIAAYNAGEKAVDSYAGVPPYPETIAYVARVLNFSGADMGLLPPTSAGKKAPRGGGGRVKLLADK